ncbi:hypothetical protein [Stenomitos frigidus]
MGLLLRTQTIVLTLYRCQTSGSVSHLQKGLTSAIGCADPSPIPCLQA